jgi:ketosteroid isomerase-like protein
MCDESHGRARERGYARAVSAGNDSARAIGEHDLAMIRRGYELWNEGDITGLSRACFADEIDYQTAPEWPGQQRFVGRVAVERFLREEVAELISLSDVRIEAIEQVGAELVITLLARTLGTASGIDLPSGEIFHVVRVHDGRVDRVRAFLNEEEARAAAAAG